MWNRDAFIAVDTTVPFAVDVGWNVRPSPEKYGVVNCLLAVLSVFCSMGGKCFDLDGSALDRLHLDPTQRKAWTRDRSKSNVIGDRGVFPHALVELPQSLFEVYFNRYLFVPTKTGLSDYLSSAAVIVSAADRHGSQEAPSARSWRVGKLSRCSDMEATLVVDAWPWEVPRRYRRGFRGFKYLDCPRKHFLSAAPLTKAEARFVSNNGFRSAVVRGADDWEPVVRRIVRSFVESGRRT